MRIEASAVDVLSGRWPSVLASLAPRAGDDGNHVICRANGPTVCPGLNVDSQTAGALALWVFRVAAAQPVGLG